MKKLDVNYRNYQVYLKQSRTEHNLILIFDDYDLLGYFWIHKGKPYSLAIINASDFQVDDIIFIKNSTNWLDLF